MGEEMNLYKEDILRKVLNGEVIQNCLKAQNKLANQITPEASKEFIRLSKFILKQIKKVDDEIVYFISECKSDGGEKPPQ